jgi:hypothetical protein
MKDNLVSTDAKRQWQTPRLKVVSTSAVTADGSGGDFDGNSFS